MKVSALRLAQGERLPWWAGVAWPNFCEHTYTILPLGIHRLARFIRTNWYVFRVGLEPTFESAIYNRGVDFGLTEGYRMGELSGHREAETAYRKGVHDGREALWAELLADVDRRMES